MLCCSSSTEALTRHGSRWSEYDVDKLLVTTGQRRTFGGVELVVASCTSSSSSAAPRRGTIRLTTRSVDGVVNESSDELRAPYCVGCPDYSYDRHNLTNFFHRLSASNVDSGLELYPVYTMKLARRAGSTSWLYELAVRSFMPSLLPCFAHRESAFSSLCDIKYFAK